jgi:hypothetical protein
MEVHHHPHAPHTKKFKEYFLEFIMIFLAVTMGFLAESLREHLTENRKEKEFIRGIIADMKTDTTKLASVVRYYDHIIPLLDSERKNFHKLQQPGALKTIILLQRSLLGFEDFIYTDATLQQIKSSGGLLLIKNKAVVDSILFYDSKVKSALINEKVLGDLLTATQHEIGGLLNMQTLLETVGRTTDTARKRILVDSLNSSTNGFLLTKDPVINGQFYNDYLYYETVATLVKMEMVELKSKATTTIDFLKRKYELKVATSD